MIVCLYQLKENGEEWFQGYYDLNNPKEVLEFAENVAWLKQCDIPYTTRERKENERI